MSTTSMIPLQDHPSSRSPPAADNSAVKEMSVLPIHESPLLSTTLQSDPDFPMYAPRGRSRVPSLPFVVCHAGSKSSSQSSSYTDTTPSPIARSRRAPSPSRTPPMHVTNTASLYTLSAQLPIEIQPEMITVSAKKGDRIDVVADAWHMETDCHYEWQIQFPHDINMNTVRVIVGKGGQLTIHAEKRRPYY